MRRALVTLLLPALIVLGVASPAVAEMPKNPCKLITKAEARELLLDKKVVAVEREEDPSKEAARCTWKTRFYQTRQFKKFKGAFSLKLDIQTIESAADALEELRSAANDIDSSVDEVDGLGDEAYERFSDLIVVTGDVVFQVGASNYDTSNPPEPDVDAIARGAAEIVLGRLTA